MVFFDVRNSAYPPLSRQHDRKGSTTAELPNPEDTGTYALVVPEVSHTSKPEWQLRFSRLVARPRGGARGGMRWDCHCLSVPDHYIDYSPASWLCRCGRAVSHGKTPKNENIVNVDYAMTYSRSVAALRE